MKRLTRGLLLCLLLLPVLTVSAFADTGPKPQLIVRVEHAPEELYYLDLVAEGTYEGHTYGSGESPYSGLDWSYSEEELAALDTELLDALRAAVPDGYHACTAQGTNGAPMWGDLCGETTDTAGDPLHQFGYIGLPDTYQILMVTKSGETFLSDPLTRTVLQSSATVDWAERTVSIPPTWVGYLLQFLSTLLPTLLIEAALLLLFGFAWKKNWKPFLLVNIITQGGLALWFSITTVQYGANPWFVLFLFLPTEVVIAIVEAILYRKFLTGQSKTRAVCYGLTANAASALLGLWIMEPVWQFVVSIS